MVRRLSDELQPATIGVVHRILSSVLKAAVADRRIALNPCSGPRLPKMVRRKVEPITTEQLFGLVEALPERYKALIVMAAGTGMRQGEVFGLTADRVDFLRRAVALDRQVTTIAGREPFFGPPTTAASLRVIPLPRVVLESLAQHLSRFPTDALLFTNIEGAALRRSAFGTAWRRAITNAGLPGLRFHDLRHY